MAVENFMVLDRRMETWCSADSSAVAQLPSTCILLYTTLSMARTSSIENAMRFVVSDCTLYAVVTGYFQSGHLILQNNLGLGFGQAGPRDSAVLNYRFFEADDCRTCVGSQAKQF
jgi:hypothetical protein